MINQFFIINKSGGMIYRYERQNQTDLNKLLILTSSLHSINHISAKVGDQNNAKQVIYLKKKIISIFKTITNTSFVFISDKEVDKTYKKIYEHYVDYVSKNPFYTPEMPINCEKFKPEIFLK